MFLNNANGSWFWPVDGVVVNSSIYLFSLRMKSVSGGFGFDYEGITMFSTPISQGNLINRRRCLPAIRRSTALGLSSSHRKHWLKDLRASGDEQFRRGRRIPARRICLRLWRAE